MLYTFAGGSDGGNPDAALTFDESGTLYGTTAYGGANGEGTVFELTPPAAAPVFGASAAWTETVLYTFTGGSDGGNPEAPLISDESGALYSTTTNGGTYGQGIVFKLAPPAVAGGAWTETVLYTFTGGSDGAMPPQGAGLIFDSSGALYGTTYAGGAYGFGTVFKLAPPARAGDPWTEIVLYSFTGGNDGSNPSAGLIPGASGALFGTTSQGGANGGGTVFQVPAALTFLGVPAEPNCVGQSISTIAKSFGGVSAAAAQLAFSSVKAFQDAIKSYCAG